MDCKKVGIWGSYNHGNYGDDIMAVIFARILKAQGYAPYVYRLDKNIAKKYDIETTESLDELTQDACFCIIGGGAWLCSGNFSAEVEEDCAQYLHSLEASKTPFYCVSIGGDGNTSPTSLSSARLRLFSSPYFQGGTVRLPTDTEILRALGKSVAFYPDIVLRVPEQLNVKKPSSSKRKIGLNLNIIQRRTHFYFKWVNKLFPWIELIEIQSHSQGHDLGFERANTNNKSSFDTIRYNTPEQFVRALSELDLIVSFKLHLGVTCLGMKVPFCSVGGSGKTQAFLQSVNMTKAIKQEELTLWQVINIFLGLHRDYYFVDETEANKLVTDADNHIRFLKGLR